MPIDINSLVGQIVHADCLEVLRELPDKSVDLILADPPYGIGEDGSRSKGRIRKDSFNACKHLSFEAKQYPKTEWDNAPPSAEFFAEMKRIGKNQIVWGGNYFTAHLTASPCWLVWDKDNGETDFADCELAWTSFRSAVRYFKWRWMGFWQERMSIHERETRYHPTQKPVPLFKWCVHNYSKPGDLILDPFAGSGTTALACHALGRRFICIERELEYVNVARNRLLQLQAQGDLFAKTGGCGCGETVAQQAQECHQSTLNL
jgi:site-specific DNA-methyltransferase (adenine-specific)